MECLVVCGSGRAHWRSGKWAMDNAACSGCLVKPQSEPGIKLAFRSILVEDFDFGIVVLL